MNLLDQINFWADEITRTASEANQLADQGELGKARARLMQSRTALARLAAEIENSDLPQIRPDVLEHIEEAEQAIEEMLNRTPT